MEMNSFGPYHNRLDQKQTTADLWTAQALIKNVKTK